MRRSSDPTANAGSVGRRGDPDAPPRRRFLRDAALAVIALSTATSRRPATAGAAVPADDLLALTATEAVAAMRTGALSAERYSGALLARCAQQASLNAFITLDPARVLEQARAADRRRAQGAPLGALHGLPIPIKDSVNTAEYPTTAGTPALKGFRPARDAPLVATLRSAGAIVLGKTNLHELSYGWTSNNLAFGAVHNPYDPTRIPGGSSGGTAAAIAAHMAPLGVAEDTEGSIRVPAALCGVIGFRPTTHRYSTEGVVPACALFDQLGPQARSMADIALFDRVASGDQRSLVDAPLAGVRLAIGRDYWFEQLDPEVERIATEALAKLREEGATLVEVSVPDLAMLIGRTADLVVDHDARLELTHYLAANRTGVSLDELVARASPDIRAIFTHEVLPGSPGFVSQSAYRTAVDEDLPRLRALFRSYFAATGAAAIVFPATRVTAPRIGEEGALSIGSGTTSFDVAIGRNIAPGSRAGLPGLVLPAGLAANGLPVALEFDGPAGSDRALLALGLTIARVLGHVPPPSLSY